MRNNTNQGAIGERKALTGGGSTTTKTVLTLTISSLLVLGMAGSGAALTPGIPAYSEDFELDDGAWTVSGSSGVWEWGTPTAGPPAVSGNVWGTVLDGEYDTNKCTQVTSPVISVAPLPDALVSQLSLATHLSIDTWYFIESAFDAAILEASTDGGATWTLVQADYDRNVGPSAQSCLGIGSSQEAWTGIADEWESHSIDISDIVDPSEGGDVQFRINFSSDPICCTEAGFFFDNVEVWTGLP